MTESSNPLFRRFRERKLFQVLVLYVGAAWGLAQVAEFVVDNYELSRRLLDVTLFLLLVGLPAAAIIAWFHGEKGHQRVQRVEAAILASLLAVATGGAWVIGTSGDAVSAEEAVALDSTFALAQMRLANTALQSGDVSRAVEALRLAREHRDAAPERDRMYVDGLLAQLVSGNAEESRRILERHH